MVGGFLSHAMSCEVMGGRGLPLYNLWLDGRHNTPAITVRSDNKNKKLLKKNNFFDNPSIYVLH